MDKYQRFENPDESCEDEKGVQFLQWAKDKALSHLLVVQGVVSAAILALAALVFFPLSITTSDFGESCILYANIKIGPSIENGTIELDLKQSTFGDIADCNYCIYINVALAVASAIFIWFFIHSKEVKDTQTSQLRLLFPVFVVHLVFFICIFSSSLEITNGNKEWCSYLEKNNKYQKKTIPCWEYEKHDWIPNSISQFYTYTQISELGSWTLTVVLGLQVCLTVVHIYRDYLSWTLPGLASDSTHSAVPPGHHTGGVTNSENQNSAQLPLKTKTCRDDVESVVGSASDKKSLISVDVHSDST